MPLVSQKLTFTRVRVFGDVGRELYVGPLYGQTKEGRRVSKIMTDHMRAGYDVEYVEYREPNDPVTVYADCTITPPSEVTT